MFVIVIDLFEYLLKLTVFTYPPPPPRPPLFVFLRNIDVLFIFRRNFTNTWAQNSHRSCACQGAASLRFRNNTSFCHFYIFTKSREKKPVKERCATSIAHSLPKFSVFIFIFQFPYSDSCKWKTVKSVMWVRLFSLAWWANSLALNFANITHHNRTDNLENEKSTEGLATHKSLSRRSKWFDNECMDTLFNFHTWATLSILLSLYWSLGSIFMTILHAIITSIHLDIVISHAKIVRSVYSSFFWLQL